MRTDPPPRFLRDYVLPLAKAYSELDLHASAWELLEPRLQTLLDSQDPAILSDTGDILYAARRYDPAREAYQRALDLLPRTQAAQRSYLLIQLGDLHRDLGQLQAAQNCYEAARALHEQRIAAGEDTAREKLAIAYQRLGDIYQAQGKFEQALEFFHKRARLGEELYQANPHSYPLIHGLAISYAKLGVLYREMGQPAQARPWLERARDIWRQLRAGLQPL